MRVSLKLNPPRDEELRSVELNDFEISTMLACNKISFIDSNYRITEKTFEIGFGGIVSLSIQAELESSLLD